MEIRRLSVAPTSAFPALVWTNPAPVSGVEPKKAERPSWSYPEPWSGVRWMPAPRPVATAVLQAVTGALYLLRSAFWACAIGMVLTACVNVLAAAGA